MVLNGDLRLFHLTLTSSYLTYSADPVWTPCSAASDLGLYCFAPSPGFTDNLSNSH